MIIGKCIEQNLKFKKLDSFKNYYTIHHSHYDWWAFPINEISSHGTKYQVDEKDMSEFKKNEKFIEALRSNAILVCKAWGYDLVQGKPFSAVTADQKWQNWPIRLYKMTKSLELFEQNDLHANAAHYGIGLIDKGHKFVYGPKDLKPYFNQFRKGNDPIL